MSLLFTLIIISSDMINAQTINPKIPEELDESVDFSPLSPFLNIYGVHYIRSLTEKDELIFGLSYMKIPYDCGHTNSPALIFGYRRYIWKNLHLEYELWPCYDEFYEKYEDKYYKSFDIWNEFRIGYRLDFQVAEKPFYLNLQWPFGFGLYASNKPDSFLAEEKEEPFFYFPPMFFVGMRF